MPWWKISLANLQNKFSCGINWCKNISDEVAIDINIQEIKWIYKNKSFLENIGVHTYGLTSTLFWLLLTVLVHLQAHSQGDQEVP